MKHLVFDVDVRLSNELVCHAFLSSESLSKLMDDFNSRLSRLHTGHLTFIVRGYSMVEECVSSSCHSYVYSEILSFRNLG